MRALQIVELTGPDTALRSVAVPRPSGHFLTPGPGVLIDVRCAGVSFPEVLQTRGAYQVQPPLPFVPGGEVSGVVRSAPGSSGYRPGDRVAAYCVLGGFAEQVVAPHHMTFALPAPLTWAEGAGLVLNYHTAYFALKLRGRLVEGETVLVHGAAGGIGTATLQLAKGLGARTIALVSDSTKETVAREAGADEVVLLHDAWKDEVRSLSDGGVDLVVDPVGGARFTDSLRSLREEGRLVVVGFTSGTIPEVKVNRLLLSNLEVVGAGWGGYVLPRPDVSKRIGAEVNRLVEEGFVRPVIGHELPFDKAPEALRLIDERAARGKVVLVVDATDD
jgi:NADPH2:quinone reductase